MAKMEGKLEDYIRKPVITEELLHPSNKLIMVISVLIGDTCEE